MVNLWQFKCLCGRYQCERMCIGFNALPMRIRHSVVWTGLYRPGSDTPSTEKKYLVFQSCLESLLRCCPVCHQHVTKTVMETTATLFTVRYTCAAGHHNRCHFRPRLRGTTAGNVLLSAAILFSGSNFTKFTHLANIPNLSILAERTFQDIQSTYLFSVVHHTWTQH